MADPPMWTNWARNQDVRAKHILYPKTVEDLQGITEDVTARKGRLKAVATGLSFSDILQTDDTLVVLADLQEHATSPVLLPLEEELWFDPVPRAPRVRIRGGARIRDLNIALANAGLAFANLGGFDGQTIVGAISTSTHGSGITLGPLPSSVVSLDLVTTFGQRYRIEPANGPTDPALFAKRYGAKMKLQKRDDWFHATVVSMGCFGIIHSVTMDVMPAYRLIEHRHISTLSRVLHELEAKIKQHRHYEISINPYPRRDGEHTCVVTERNLAPLTAATIPLPKQTEWTERIIFMPSAQKEILWLMSHLPRALPAMLETTMMALATGPNGHVDDSYKIYNLNKLNTAEVLSGEYFFPLRDKLYVRGLYEMLRAVAQNQKRGIYQTGPISLRFIKGAKAHLSMTEGDEIWVSMEIPAYRGVPGAALAIASYEKVCCANQGRPHWGQMHEQTGERGWLERAYPKAKLWSQVFHELNPAGVFDNHFTDRMGFRP